MICTFWDGNLWTCSIIDLFPSSGLHKPSTHSPRVGQMSVFHSVGQRSSWGIRRGKFLHITSFNCYNLKIPRGYSFPCFFLLYLISHVSECYKTIPSHPSNLSIISATNNEWNVLTPTLSWAWEVIIALNSKPLLSTQNLKMSHNT